MKTTLEVHMLSCNVTSIKFAFSSIKSISRTSETCSLTLPTICYKKSREDEQHHSLLDDTKEKFQLYLGHYVRVQKQCNSIDKILSLLGKYKAMLLMDLKIKFESIYYYEYQERKVFLIIKLHILITFFVRGY